MYLYQLEYKKEHKKDIKKGWEFIKDTPAQVFNEDIQKVQSKVRL